MNRKIIVGDIHACHSELLALLDKVGMGDGDEVIALGDIFDRGPDNRSILKLFSEDPRFSTIKGNHERKHLLSHQHKCKAAASQIFTRAELSDEYPQLLNFVREIPNYIILDEAILVHGAMEPGVPMEEQKETVLLSTLTGQKYLEKNYPAPWYELIETDRPVIFGHQTFEGVFVFKDKIFGLDTGCCHGGKLSAIVLPEFQIVSVPAQRDYWRETRMKYANEFSFFS